MIDIFLSVPDMTMKCRPGEINANSIQIKWNNAFPECFNFSVWLNGSVIQTESADKLNYTVAIDELSPNTAHNVCVVAQDGLGRTKKNWTHCDNISTKEMKREFMY